MTARPVEFHSHGRLARSFARGRLSASGALESGHSDSQLARDTHIDSSLTAPLSLSPSLHRSPTHSPAGARQGISPPPTTVPSTFTDFTRSRGRYRKKAQRSIHTSDRCAFAVAACLPRPTVDKEMLPNPARRQGGG